MTNSTTAHKNRTIRLWAVLLWLLIWQAFSMYIGQEILLASPLAVLLRLGQLLLESDFWQAVWFSLRRIATGFLLAMTAGVLLAALAAHARRVEELLAPIMLFVKATPVASFIILVLIWVNSRNLSVIISFLMVWPIMYTNVLAGIKATDKKLLEMADIFEIPRLKRLTHIYVSQVLPHFEAACLVGLGLCWKSGIAAEVIGIPTGSIGERLYTAKIYLATPDLFAWTLTIILLSVGFEKLFMCLLRAVIARVERA